jgi:coproporphyrinogen III oxidase-like Fe-S oxidoreductase
MAQVETQGHGSMEATPLTALQSLHVFSSNTTVAHFQEFLLCGMRKLVGITRQEMLQYSGKQFEDVIDTKKLISLVPTEYIVLDSTGLRATELGFPILDVLLLKVFTCIKT